MDTHQIRKMITSAVAEEEKHGQMALTIQQTLIQQGIELTSEAIREIVQFAEQYVKAVPDFLEQGESAGQQLGLQAEIDQLLRELKRYWSEPDDLMPDQLGLTGLMDDAYGSMFLLQTVSENCQKRYGKPLLDQSFKDANKGVRQLLGEAIAGRIEEGARITVNNAIFQSSIQRLMTNDWSNAYCSTSGLSPADLERVLNSHLRKMEGLGTVAPATGKVVPATGTRKKVTASKPAKPHRPKGAAGAADDELSLDAGDTDGGPGEPPAKRKVWPHLECDPTVLIGNPFEVEVGLQRERDKQLGGTGSMELPAEGCVLDVEIIFDPTSFVVVEGTRSFPLKVTPDNFYPRKMIKLVAISGADLPGQRDIGVSYSLNGVVIGYANRRVQAVTDMAQARPPEPPPVFAGMELEDFMAREEADLTIIIKRGDDAGSGRLAFATCSPHYRISVPEEPPTSNLGTHPETFLEVTRERADSSISQRELFRTLMGRGKDIAAKLPDAVVEALQKIASIKGGEPASVLVITDEPCVPWELAVLDSPLLKGDAGQSPFLGAQAALGRWILPSGKRPSPRPSRHLRIRKEAVVTGAYERVMDFNKLEGAEEEARDLLKAWKDSSRKVDATMDDVLDCLDGTPAVDLLHFALHGQFDLSGSEEGLVLIDPSPDGSDSDNHKFLTSDIVRSCDFSKFGRAPFVFLNACQVGSGREMLGDYAGMTKAFLSAGASAVVAPLWSIDDKDAHRLALDFYINSWKGVPPAEILRQQRASFTEKNSKQGEPSSAGSTNLAYQFFGHPRFVLERDNP